MNSTNNTEFQNVVLYDGVCNLCHSSVRFVLKRDKNKVFAFAGLQSELAKNLLKAFHSKELSEDLNSIVLLQNGKLYYKSTAALRIAKKLNGLWPLLSICLVIPPFIRDAVYTFIANNRYKWFGKKDVCQIPLHVDKSRFLDYEELKS